MTMQVIQHIELGSAQASITFSSIPNTFTDLLLVFSLRTDVASTNAKVRFNGSSSNYSSRSLFGSGSGVTSETTVRIVGGVNASNTTSNTFANGQVYIPNYASSQAKSFSIDSANENNATTAYQTIVAGLWNDTAAITSIALSEFDNVSNLVAGSSATLFGITKGSDGITTVS